MYKGMIVDDAAIMRMRLKEILDPHFDIISEAGDGEQALRNFETSKPDFVTLDITMPKMNGIETLKKLINKW
jgi:two-component system chemotaxis response regulator CheY